MFFHFGRECKERLARIRGAAVEPAFEGGRGGELPKEPRLAVDSQWSTSTEELCDMEFLLTKCRQFLRLHNSVLLLQILSGFFQSCIANLMFYGFYLVNDNPINQRYFTEARYFRIVFIKELQNSFYTL